MSSFKKNLYLVSISYIGLFIGVLNILLYSSVLLPSQKGLIDSLLSSSTFITAISGFGLSFGINKYLPYYLEYYGYKNDFTSFIFRSIFISLITITLLIFLLTEYLYSSDNNLLFLKDNYYYILLLSFGQIIYLNLNAFSIGLSENLYTTFINEIVIKTINLFLILLMKFHLINFDYFIFFNSIIFLTIIFFLGFNLYIKNKLKVTLRTSILTKRLRNKIITFNFYSWLSNSFHLSIQFFEGIFILAIINISTYAIYTFAIQLTLFMTIFQRNLINEHIPKISSYNKNLQFNELSILYKKSANDLLTIGGIFFCLILINFNEIFIFLRKEYIDSYSLFLILGVSKLLDFLTSINSQILNLSKKYWKYDIFINILCISILIPANYIFIKKYGVIGAAIVNFLIYLSFNFLKTLFVHKYLSIHPFNKRNFILLIYILTFVLLINLTKNTYSFIEYQNHITMALILIFKNIIFLLIFIAPLYLLNVTIELNKVIDKLKNKIIYTISNYY